MLREILRRAIYNKMVIRLAFERSRQFYRSLALAKKDPTLNFSTITRVIWYNTDNGFERIRIDPNYYPRASEDIKQAIIKHATNLELQQRGIHRHSSIIPLISRGTIVTGIEPVTPTMST